MAAGGTRVALLMMVAACGSSSTGVDGGEGRSATDATTDSSTAATDDASTEDASPSGDGAGAPDGAAAPDAAVATQRILFQCTPFAGGICFMRADGSGVETLRGDGFAPRALADGTIVFHSAAYHVLRRHPDGRIDDLGAGAFARPRGARLIFQCDGLGGGVCAMDLDGRNRTTVRAAGRVPDVADDGAILLHTDGYRVVRHDAGGTERDLGAGAFAVWTPAGDILFQCSGLDGGLCRMARDGSGRTPIAAAGRVPAVNEDGAIVFHTDDYRIAVRTPSGTTTLRSGANAVWW